MKKSIYLIIWLTVFSIAMGYLECAVAVYLRKIYFPAGFNFPLVSMNQLLSVTELIRELATVLMLLAVGMIAGKNPLQRFACFAYCFGIWDIFYYVFLKLLLGWPESIFSWDLLFMLPVPWIGPVLAPVIVSLTLIVFSLLIFYFVEKQLTMRMHFREWALMIAGCCLIFLTFIWEFMNYLARFTLEGSKLNIKGGFWGVMVHFEPQNFNWLLFISGEIILAIGIILYIFRLKKNIKSQKTHFLQF